MSIYSFHFIRLCLSSLSVESSRLSGSDPIVGIGGQVLFVLHSVFHRGKRFICQVFQKKTPFQQEVITNPLKGWESTYFH